MNKKTCKSAYKPQKNVRSSWVDFVYFSTILIFAKNGSLVGVFLDVNPLYDCGSLTPYKDKRVYINYVDYVIPYYECTFMIHGLRLPFTAFEI